MPRSPYRPNGRAVLCTAADCVLSSAVTRALLSERIHSAPSTTMMAASGTSRSSAVPRCPSEASWIECAASPGGIHRSQESIPSKLPAVSLPSAVSLGTICTKPSYRAKIGMISSAAKSLPRRERSIPARPVVTNRARVRQNSTCSSTASTAMITPAGPRASPTVTPSRPIRVAAGHGPVADAASRPTASGRVRSGYRASVAGSSVVSRPNTTSGRISQANANKVKTTVVRSTAALWPRSRASPAKTPAATSTARIVLVMNAALAPVDARSALRISWSLSWTRSRATSAPLRRPPCARPGR